MATNTATPAPTLGGRVAQARRFLGITQRDFGARVGVSRETVSAWENNHGAPDVVQLMAIAEVLERDPCWFIENLRVSGGGAEQSGWIYGLSPPDRSPELPLIWPDPERDAA